MPVCLKTKKGDAANRLTLFNRKNVKINTRLWQIVGNRPVGRNRQIIFKPNHITAACTNNLFFYYLFAKIRCLLLAELLLHLRKLTDYILLGTVEQDKTSELARKCMQLKGQDYELITAVINKFLECNKK